MDITLLEAQGSNWALELQKILESLKKQLPSWHLSAESVHCTGHDQDLKNLGEVLFIDQKLIEQGLLKRISRRGRVLVMVSPTSSQDPLMLPRALIQNDVDEVLAHPFRATEILNHLKQQQRVKDLAEIEQLNSRFNVMLDHLQDDLNLAERLQKARLPEKFPEIKGFDIKARYLAGLRAGGDHFDLAEGKTGGRICLVLTDSSSYRLASAVMALLVKVAMKLTLEQSSSSRQTVEKILEELQLILGEKDDLSLFYGVVTRADLKLRYTLQGSCWAAVRREGQGFTVLPSAGTSLNRSSSVSVLSEGEHQLGPGDRLLISSAGFIQAAGGEEQLLKLLNQKSGAEPHDILNELTFKVKSTLEEADDLPERDCTAVVFDVMSNVLRLA